MADQSWPDSLEAPDPRDVQALLSAFWQELDRLPALLAREEHLLAEASTASLRRIVLEMMLALNGIRWPVGTANLNTYLSESQRAAVEKTLIASTVAGHVWIARAVSLVVIYRWYAPQLVEKLNLAYPHDLEQSVWARLLRELPAWPEQVTTG